MKLQKGQAVFIKGRKYEGEVPDEYLSPELKKALEKKAGKKSKPKDPPKG